MSFSSTSRSGSLRIIASAFALASLFVSPASAAPKIKGLKPTQVLGMYSVSAKIKSISCTDDAVSALTFNDSDFSGLLDGERVTLSVEPDENGGTYAFLEHDEEDNYSLFDVTGNLEKAKSKVLFSTDEPYQYEDEITGEDDSVTVLSEELSLDLSFVGSKKNSKAVNVVGTIHITVAVSDSYDEVDFGDGSPDDEFDLDAFIRKNQVPEIDDSDGSDLGDESDWTDEEPSSVCEIELRFTGKKIQ